jgi:sec-independent protein translocase protein TatA
MSPLFAMFGLGAMEIAMLGVVAVILFGKKLPEVAKSLGKSVVSFKQGMHGLEEGINDIGSPAPRAESAPAEAMRPPQRVTATAPKFEDSPANPPQV